MNSAKLRIAVADDEQDMREFLTESLERLGHEVLYAVDSGRKLVERVKENPPDLIITDIKMPDMDGLEAARHIYQQTPLPLIIVSAYHDPEYVERADASHVIAYLLKPIKESNLGPAITIAMRRFEELRALQKEATDLRQALNDRKIIERAKGILMKQAKLDEPAAFRRLQKLASSHNKKLVDIADMIVTASQAMAPDTDG
ncbi:MAG TPA: response regulator [Pirellulales bacterium]|jgi:response regulator NasT|nr:response regulator [Pirellulales bacterium]